MKTSTVLIAVVFSAVATVWSAGPDDPSAKRNAAPAASRRALEPPSPPTPGSHAIRQFVEDLRREAIDRWFHGRRADEEFGLDAWNDDAWDDDAWWDEALEAPQRRAVVEAETGEQAVSAAASGQGTAVSMAVVDGHYDIEAAWSGEEGPQRFRVQGTRAQVQRWAAQLPEPLKRAVERQLASTDFDGPAW